MSNQLLKTATVSLTCMPTTATTNTKPSPAVMPSQSTVVSVPSSATQFVFPSVQSTVPSQSATVTKQKPPDTASSALNKTFEKEHSSDSWVLFANFLTFKLVVHNSTSICVFRSLGTMGIFSLRKCITYVSIIYLFICFYSFISLIITSASITVWLISCLMFTVMIAYN